MGASVRHVNHRAAASSSRLHDFPTLLRGRYRHHRLERLMVLVQVSPTRAFFQPGERVQIRVAFDMPKRVPITVTIYHLAEQIAVWETTCDGLSVVLEGD